MSKRDDILTATLDLIVEGGLHAFSFSKLFARAGVGSGTVYNYFANKDELVRTLYLETTAVMDSILLADYDPEADLRTRFEALLRNMASFAASHRRELALLSACEHTALITPELRWNASPALEVSLAIMIEGQQSGAFAPMEPMLAVSLVSSALLGAVRGQAEGKYKPEVPVLEQTLAACWRLVAAPESARSPAC